MLVAPFPGLQQLALFSSIGLFSAYATVICWYPILAATPSPDRRLPYEQALSYWIKFWQKPSIRISLPIGLIIASSMGLYHARYNDDIRQLQAMPKNLKQQEQTIKRISGIQHDQQMLLVRAEDSDHLLDKLQSVSELLEQQIKDEHLAGYQSISQFISSPKQQQKNFKLTQSLYQTQGQGLTQALKLKQPPELSTTFTPIHIQDFLASPISKPVRFMWLGKIENQTSAIITLNGVKDSQAITTLAQQDPQISYLNKTQEVSQLFGLYRQHISLLLVLASMVIWFVVSLRYGLTQGLRIVLPAVIAGAVGIAVTTLTGNDLNLFNLLALILVLGIDYTLFFAELSHSGVKTTPRQSSLPQQIQNTQSPQFNRQSHATLLAISLSAVTTILSFGLLALSQTQAIYSFGITVLFGIISWLLAPLAMKPPTTRSKES